MREVAFAVPGDLATPTGGYTYDRRILAELPALGWQTHVVALGEGFPRPSAAIRADALTALAALPPGRVIVIDGLAFGVLPEVGRALAQTHRLVALVHHPLALESGLSEHEAAAVRQSECAALAAARHVIATSHTTARILTADYDVPGARLSVVTPGTDRKPAGPRNRAAEVTLLAVGAVVPRKGYDLLVAALSELTSLPWRLVIVGDGSRSPATRAQLEADIAARGLGARVALAGAVSEAELARHYAAADLFVLPSRFEGYGMAFTEAVAHGLPVVGTTAGAIPEAVPPSAGVLVPPDDVAALAAALQRLISSAEERERLASGARAAVFPSWRAQAQLFAHVLAGIA